HKAHLRGLGEETLSRRRPTSRFCCRDFSRPNDPMTRFFVRPEQMQNGTATLDEADAYHLRVVLKAAPGEPVAILDGTGAEFPGRLGQLGKTRATVAVGEAFWPKTEPRTQIMVAQALPKMAEKMEHVLQHGTEIGASAFWAFACERSVTHLTGERQAKRLGRWESIIKTAAEQAHRARLPALRVEDSLADVLASAAQYDLTLLAHPDTTTTLREALSETQPKSVLIVIGPESGFTPSEVAAAKRAEVRTISLGPRILRTETAALTLASQILYALE
nr:16S rRNA (uracil(1498)-N(3))-methyltransferase [Armatimonadota bacterium]